MYHVETRMTHLLRYKLHVRQRLWGCPIPVSFQAEDGRKRMAKKKLASILQKRLSFGSRQPDSLGGARTSIRAFGVSKQAVLCLQGPVLPKQHFPNLIGGPLVTWNGSLLPVQSHVQPPMHDAQGSSVTTFSTSVTEKQTRDT